MQASAYIPSIVFDEFRLKEDVTFSLSLNILVECLCMFWPTAQEDSVAVQIFYKVNLTSGYFHHNQDNSHPFYSTNKKIQYKFLEFIFRFVLN